MFFESIRNELRSLLNIIIHLYQKKRGFWIELGHQNPQEIPTQTRPKRLKIFPRLVPKM
jgi:hypothetical protein